MKFAPGLPAGAFDFSGLQFRLPERTECPTCSGGASSLGCVANSCRTGIDSDSTY